MIENFLLDPDSIWEAIQSVIERSGFQTVDDVGAALDNVIQSISEAEIGRRTAAQLGGSHFYPPSTLDEITGSAEVFKEEVSLKYSREVIERAEQLSRDKVEALNRERRRREEFHGKTALAEFYRSYLHQTGLSKVIFTFETARYARRRRSVVSFFDSFFERLSA